MSMFQIGIDEVSPLILERDRLNAMRSARLREEGPGVCLDKDYRLLCKRINELTSLIHKKANKVNQFQI